MRFRDVPRRTLQSLIAAYAYIVSPLMGANCRFYPTCSAYAGQALERHGVIRGLWLTFRRLLKCHPWHRGPMLDPVPDPGACDKSCRH